MNNPNSYNGNVRVKKDGVEQEYSEHELTEYLKCSEDPVYFISNYVKVISLDKGLVLFKLRGYQEKMIRHLHDNKYSCILSGRQSGKSITMIAYLLWYVCFHSEKTAAVLANKGAIAREMLSRLTLMLENLPFFLQPGCKILNKGSIEFSNNSKVVAAATSSSSIRGMSINCVSGDTKICISEDDNIFHLSIEDLINKSRFIEKDMKKLFTIYQIRNIVNNKIYVGFHATYNVNDGYMGSGKLIRRAIEKYGISNFEKKILSIHETKEEAEDEEVKIVNRDFTLREDTYNLNIGGNVRISYGKNNGFYGKTHSTKTRKNISEKASGRINDKTRQKIIDEFGVIHETLTIAARNIEYVKDLNLYAAKSKLLYDCGDPDKNIKFLEGENQKKAEDYFVKRNIHLETIPETRKRVGLLTKSRMTGKKYPPEFRRQISERLKGVKKTKEHMDKINKNPEKIRKTAEKHRGMKRSAETKLKMSFAKKGRKALNTGKKFYRNPNNVAEHGYFSEDEIPVGYIQGTGPRK